MNGARPPLVGCLLVALGCQDVDYEPSEEGAAEVTSSTASAETSTNSSVDTTADDGEAETDDGQATAGFLADDMEPVGGCAPGWPHECPKGEKCSAIVIEPGYWWWDHNTCVPLLGDVGVGEPCQVLGEPLSGEDDCAPGLICWAADAQGQGACIAYCTDGWMCPEGGGQCVANGDGVIAACMPPCDPRDPQPCPTAREVCTPRTQGVPWICKLIDADAGAEAEPCASPSVYGGGCQPGLACIADAFFAAECEGSCCTEVCDVIDPLACGGAGMGTQSCVPFYDADPPVGLETLGVCVVP